MKLKMDIIQMFNVDSNETPILDLLKEGYYDSVHEAVSTAVTQDVEKVPTGQVSFALAEFDPEVAMKWLNIYKPKVRSFGFRVAYVNSGPACKIIHEEGFRLANFAETLLFGKECPEVQTQHHILSGYWNMHLRMYQTILMSENGNRMVDVMNHSCNWTCGWKFLLVEKKNLPVAVS